MRDRVIAGVLSLILPGLVKISNGRDLGGSVWLIFASGLWFGTGFLLGWILHLVAAYCAYSYAKEHPYRG
jgi:hypothetical protein